MSQHDPTTDEVLQDEERPLRTVSVAIDSPVRAQTLPAVVWTRIARSVDTTPQRILPHDARRNRAIFLSGAGNVHYAPSQEEARSAVGVDKGWPANTPFEIHHNLEVWIASDSGAQSVVVFIESWTE